MIGKSVKIKSKLITKNNDYLEGVIDLKNCYYYFMTNTSRDSGKNLANYYDSQRYCLKSIESNYEVDLIRFVDDLQISTIISLFKAGK